MDLIEFNNFFARIKFSPSPKNNLCSKWPLISSFEKYFMFKRCPIYFCCCDFCSFFVSPGIEKMLLSFFFFSTKLRILNLSAAVLKVKIKIWSNCFALLCFVLMLLCVLLTSMEQADCIMIRSLLSLHPKVDMVSSS